MRCPERPVERVGDAERTEGRLEGRAQALDRRADDQDLLRRRAGAEELEDLVGDQLERGAGACALEQADRALGRRRRRRLILEQGPLEVGERRVRVVGIARRQLLDPPGCEPRQVGGRPLERREGEPPGLVLQRHGDVHPPRERLEQAPLCAAQVLEAVGVDRTTVPGGEVVRDPARGVAALKVAVPETEPVELLAIASVELGEVAVDVLGLQQPRFELRDGRTERIAESRESRRRVELAERRTRHHPAQDQRALRVAGDRPRSAVPGRDPLEDVVERPDRSAEQCARADEQVALDPFDVRPGRHDQDRLPRQIGEVAIEEQSHFAGVGRPGQQRQGHRPILVPRSDGSAYAAGRETGKEREKRAQSSGTGRTRPRGSVQAATDLGLRPRRAVARPGMPVAHESQRSASFAPRRASEKDRRIVAPFPSSTSLLHWSQTRTVFRANSILRVRGSRTSRVTEIARRMAAVILREMRGCRRVFLVSSTPVREFAASGAAAVSRPELASRRCSTCSPTRTSRPPERIPPWTPRRSSSSKGTRPARSCSRRRCGCSPPT